MTKTQPHTPRRSARFKPFLQKSARRGSSQGHCQWTSTSPIHTRPTIRDDLFEDGECERWDDEVDDDGELDEKKTSELRITSFYAGFRRDLNEDSAEVYEIGDTVLVHTGAKLDSIGVITAMWETVPFVEPPSEDEDEDEDEDGEGKDADMRMKVKIHWFLRPSELASIRAKRLHLEGEIYFSLTSTAILAPCQISAHCTVSSVPQNPPSSPNQPPRKRPKVGGSHGASRLHSERDHFFCQSAVDPPRGIFYSFAWDKHRAHALDAAERDGSWVNEVVWCVAIDEGPTRPMKRKVSGAGGDIESESDGNSGDEFKASEDEEEEVDDHDQPLTEEDDSSVEEGYELPKTPARKRKRGRASASASPTKRATSRTNALSTPRKQRQRQTVQPTPHSKKALAQRSTKKLRKSPLKVRPPPPTPLSPRKQSYMQTLPKDPWLRATHALHVAARPDGVQLPCREDEYAKILRSVEELVGEGSGGCVYISGVPGTGKTATVYAVVRELKRMAEENETNPFTYVEINGLKIPEPSAAYALLWEAVSGHDATKEGRLKISSKEALKNLGKHFSGIGRGPGGHACVVLMDELDQLVTAKQDVVYNFFNWPTIVGSRLVVIAVANTMDLPERVMTGRVRSRLGMIRINFQPYTTPQLEKIVHSRLAIASEGLGQEQHVVITNDGIKFAAMKVSSISGDARRVLDICRRTVELVHLERRAARTEDVKDVIKVMQNSPTAAYLRECSFHERMMLAAVIKCVKREGVEEVKWGDVQHQHRIYIPILGDTNQELRPSSAELTQVLDSLLASRAMLTEDGGLATRKSESERRVVLNLEQAEVERTLGDVGGMRWKNALSV